MFNQLCSTTIDVEELRWKYFRTGGLVRCDPGYTGSNTRTPVRDTDRSEISAYRKSEAFDPLNSLLCIILRRWLECYRE